MLSKNKDINIDKLDNITIKGILFKLKEHFLHINILDQIFILPLKEFGVRNSAIKKKLLKHYDTFHYI